jgi:U5 small nuclear ribonucleoprotein component
MNTRVAKSMLNLDPNGPLMIHVTKLYANHQTKGVTAGQSFSAFGRIYSGSVKAGDKVKVMGEAYSAEDDEDMAFATVESVCIPRGRFSTEVNIATAGSWVLLEGVDANILKTATITNVKSTGDDKDIEIFAPLKFSQAGGESVMKLSVEPLNPSELPKMVEGLRRVSKAYPMARTRVEESGEHVLFGTGELYMDSVMHDLRHIYSDIEVKVADPVVGFRETVIETSSIKCFAEVRLDSAD